MLKKISCIYGILCLVNNKIYIGRTQDLYRRKREHICKLKNNKHGNKNLQQDYNRYGSSQFKWLVIELINDKALLIEKETDYINLYGGIESSNVYNELDKNNLSNTTRLKIKQNNYMKGKHHSIEAKKKISYYTKIRMSQSNPIKGKHHSIEAKKKISHNMTKDKNPMFNKRKYSQDFIDTLRKEKTDYVTYKSLGEKYNLRPDIISNLIRFGVPSNIHNYKYVIINKDK